MNGRRFLAMTGVLAIGLSVAVARAQEPANEKADNDDRAPTVAELRARLELAVLDHDVMTELLKESLLLLRRAERSRLIEGAKEGESENASRREEELQRLARYVERQTEAYAAQVVAIDRLRHELVQLEPGPRTPLAGMNIEVPVGAVVPGEIVVAEPNPRVPVLEPRFKGSPDELLDKADEIEQEVLLLQARLQAYSSTLNQWRNQLVNLEVEASKPEKRGDKSLQKAVEDAREQMRQARKNRFDLAQRLAREQERLNQIRSQVGPGPDVVPQ